MSSISYTGCSQDSPTRGSSSGSTSSYFPQKRLVRYTEGLKKSSKILCLFFRFFYFLTFNKSFTLKSSNRFSVLCNFKPLVQILSVVWWHQNSRGCAVPDHSALLVTVPFLLIFLLVSLYVLFCNANTISGAINVMTQLRSPFFKEFTRTHVSLLVSEMFK